MRQVVIAVVLSALGSIAVLGMWVLLNALLWQPYWRELRKLGFYTHDVGAAFLISLGVPAIGCLYFMGGLAEVLAQTISDRESMLRSVAFYVGAPSILMIRQWFRNEGWDYPLAGVSVILIATALGSAHYQLTSRGDA